MDNLICLTCRKLFQPNPGNKKPQKFCSVPCYNAYRAAHPEFYGKKAKTFTCEWCGKPVKRKPSEIQVSQHVYCSRTCANQAQSQKLRDHSELRTCQGVPVICQNCGQTFYVKPYRGAKAKFCSKVCCYAYRFGRPLARQEHDQTGTANPNYRGTNNLVTARQTAFRYFPHKCMVCGFDIAVDVHHITPRRHNGGNNPENLIILCPNHHAMANRGLIPPDELTAITRAAIAQLSDRPHPSDPQKSVQDGNGLPSP